MTDFRLRMRWTGSHTQSKPLSRRAGIKSSINSQGKWDDGESSEVRMNVAADTVPRRIPARSIFKYSTRIILRIRFFS